jgi:endonuclease/exonuclease/phosphatase family metal-dependent hydrolase
MSVARAWTVLTWNVHGSSRPATRRLAEVIAAQRPDVVALQEVRWHQAALLSRHLHMRRTWVLKHFPYTPLVPWAAEGMAILTPHQLLRPGARIISRGATVLTYRRRLAQWATIVRGHPSNRDEVLLFNAHLSPGDLADQRRSEAANLDAVARRVGGPLPLVIAGDLNDANDPRVVAALPAVEAEPPPFTNPADRPYQLLDHVLVPPEASNVTTSVPTGGQEWARLSDHLPVTVRFTLALDRKPDD